MANEKTSISIEYINDLAMTDSASLVFDSENNYNRQIETIAKTVIAKKAKFVLLAGPSSAGKTTTSYKIKDALIKQGFGAFVMSLDDFLFGAESLPLKPNGKPDFETVYSLDIHTLNRCIEELLNHNRTSLPNFDFKLGRRSNVWTPCILKKQTDIVIIEGLHALNPIIIGKLDAKKFYKVYAQTYTVFTGMDKPLITERELRLFRRIIRDSRERNTNPLRTITMWQDVCAGEDIYIAPFKPLVDYFLDTTHYFEPLLYKKIALKQLGTLNNTTAKGLVSKLPYVGTINGSLIPQNSLIREFYQND